MITVKERAKTNRGIEYDIILDKTYSLKGFLDEIVKLGDSRVDIYSTNDKNHLILEARILVQKAKTINPDGGYYVARGEVKDFDCTISLVLAKKQFGEMIYTVSLKPVCFYAKTDSDFVKGEKFMRDAVIATIIGMQNDIGTGNPKYQAYQDVLETVIDRYGDMYQDVKI